jgi:excisionase family DNA binding protein
MTTSTDDRLLSVSEAAAESGRDRSTLHRAITAGTLTATMIGTQWVIRPADLRAYMERQKRRRTSPRSRGGLRSTPNPD